MSSKNSPDDGDGKKIVTARVLIDVSSRLVVRCSSGGGSIEM
jgi:hypothetical protein